VSETTAPRRAAGRCLCGAVAYEIHGPMRDVVSCHCGQCLRTHGNFASYTNVRRGDLALIETRGLKWYESSDFARRGFCGTCGASLFWEPQGKGTISVAAGTLDPPTNLKTVAHIFVADKGDYYEIADGLKTYPASQMKA
jgi:hypothetical protein